MSLVSLQEFRTQAGAGADTAGDQAHLSAAEAAVKAYCRRDFEAASRTEYLDGSGTSELVLPGAWLPVTAVTEVRLDLAGGRGQKTDTFGGTAVLTPGTDYSVDLAKGIIRRESFAGGGVPWGWPATAGPSNYWGGLATAGGRPAYWPRLPGVIRVVATTGYAAGQAPEDLKRAICLLASWVRLTTTTGGLLPGSVSYIDTSASLQVAAEVIGDRTIPAMGTARQLLAPYREVVLAGGVR